jgi:hypothetical protein
MGACFQSSLCDEFLFRDRIPAALKMVFQTRIRPLIYTLLCIVLVRVISWIILFGL